MSGIRSSFLRNMPWFLVLMALCALPALSYDDYRIDGVVLEWTLAPNDGDIYPRTLAVDADGRVYVVFWRAPVQIFDSGGQPLGTIGQHCDCYCSPSCDCPPGYFQGVQGLALDANGMVYVSDDCMQRIQKFTITPVNGGVSAAYAGEFPVTFGPTSSWTTYPYGLAVDSAGDVFVCGYWIGGGRYAEVLRYSNAGVNLGSYGGSLNLPIDVDVDSRDRIYATQHWALPRWTGGDSVAVFDHDGTHLADLGTQGPNPTYPWHPANTPPPPHGDAEFQGMTALVVDDRDVVYVVDRDNHRIQAFDADGSYLGWYGQGTLTAGWHDPGTGETPMAGDGPGALRFPNAIAVGPDRSLWVAQLGDWNVGGDERVMKLSRVSYTTEQLLEGMAGDVASLLDNGTFNKGQANALTVKLQHVAGLLERGKHRAAANVLEAFLQQVESLVAEGVLSPEDGQYLAHWGEIVLSEILAM